MDEGSPEQSGGGGEEPWPPAVAHRLLGAYYILRAFSWQLRLSPFQLQDLKAALGLERASGLLNEVFVSLVRALAFGESKEERCARLLPLDQVDYVTWAEFAWEWLEATRQRDLTAVAYRERRRGRLGTVDGTEGAETASHEWWRQLTAPQRSWADRVEFWTLPLHFKVEVLATMADDLLMVPAVRNEINRRQMYGPWCGFGANNDDTASQDSEQSNGGRPEVLGLGVGEDGHVDDCMLCSVGGNLVCCDGCPAAYHLRCVGEGAKALKEESWLCPECRAGGRGLAAGLRIPVAGYGPHGSVFWAADNLLVEGQDDGIRIYTGEEALRELKETVNGRISQGMGITEVKALSADDKAKLSPGPDGYVNSYKSSWVPAMKGMEMFLQSIRTKPKKEKEVYGPLPVPIPISKFPWPQSMGRGQRRYLLRCGACKHCTTPSLHRACLNPAPKLVQGGGASGSTVQTAISPVLFYLLKLENEIWGLLDGDWSGSNGLDHRRSWMARVRAVRTAPDATQYFLQLLDAIPPHSPILLDSWDPCWSRGKGKGQRAKPNAAPETQAADSAAKAEEKEGQEQGENKPSVTEGSLSLVDGMAIQEQELAREGIANGAAEVTPVVQAARDKDTEDGTSSDDDATDVSDDGPDDWRLSDAYNSVHMFSGWMYVRGKLAQSKGSSMLPRKMARKAARTGGRSKLPGVSYRLSKKEPKPRVASGLEVIAALEHCTTLAQLGMVIRALDVHINWEALKQPSPDSGHEYLNATIVGRKEAEDGSSLCELAFNPVDNGEGAVVEDKENCWVSAAEVPLWLMKRYEENKRREEANNGKGMATPQTEEGITPELETNLAQLAAAGGLEVCGVCQRPDDGMWVACDKCATWFHVFCVGLLPEEVNSWSDDQIWYCWNCQEQIVEGKKGRRKRTRDATKGSSTGRKRKREGEDDVVERSGSAKLETSAALAIAPMAICSQFGNTWYVEETTPSCTTCLSSHDGMWIGCDRCDRWHHVTCVGLDPNDVSQWPEDKKWLCSACTKRKKKSGKRKSRSQQQSSKKKRRPTDPAPMAAVLATETMEASQRPTTDAALPSTSEPRLIVRLTFVEDRTAAPLPEPADSCEEHSPAAQEANGMGPLSPRKQEKAGQVEVKVHIDTESRPAPQNSSTGGGLPPEDVSVLEERPCIGKQGILPQPGADSGRPTAQEQETGLSMHTRGIDGSMVPPVLTHRSVEEKPGSASEGQKSPRTRVTFVLSSRSKVPKEGDVSVCNASAQASTEAEGNKRRSLRLGSKKMPTTPASEEEVVRGRNKRRRSLKVEPTLPSTTGTSGQVGDHTPKPVDPDSRGAQCLPACGPSSSDVCQPIVAATPPFPTPAKKIDDVAPTHVNETKGIQKCTAEDVPEPRKCSTSDAKTDRGSSVRRSRRLARLSSGADPPAEGGVAVSTPQAKPEVVPDVAPETGGLKGASVSSGKRRRGRPRKSTSRQSCPVVQAPSLQDARTR